MSEKEKKQEQQKEKIPLGIKTKVIITGEEDFFGPGIYHLLQNIDETGSIQAAASRMKMSYSKCWKLINRAEKQLGFLLLERHNGGRNGGRSDITQAGRQFMERYRTMLEDVKRVSQNLFELYFREYL